MGFVFQRNIRHAACYGVMGLAYKRAMLETSKISQTIFSGWANRPPRPPLRASRLFVFSQTLLNVSIYVYLPIPSHCIVMYYFKMAYHVKNGVKRFIQNYTTTQQYDTTISDNLTIITTFMAAFLIVFWLPYYVHTLWNEYSFQHYTSSNRPVSLLRYSIPCITWWRWSIAALIHGVSL